MATLQSQINILSANISKLHKTIPESGQDEINLEYDKTKTTFTKNVEVTEINNLGSKAYDTIIFIGESGNYIMKYGNDAKKKIYKLKDEDQITLGIILKFSGTCVKIISNPFPTPNGYDNTSTSNYEVKFIEYLIISGNKITEATTINSIIDIHVDKMPVENLFIYRRHNSTYGNVRIDSKGIYYPDYYVEFKEFNKNAEYAAQEILITDIKMVSECIDSNVWNDIISVKGNIETDNIITTESKVKLIFKNISVI